MNRAHVEVDPLDAHDGRGVTNRVLGGWLILGRLTAMLSLAPPSNSLSRVDPSQIEPAISEFETRLERLRVLYEQYFMGIEKRPPEVQKKDIERRAFDLRKVRFPTTASRFKFQTLVQRYNTLQQYWNRTCRDIENGTFRRHVQRAERRFASAPPEELRRNAEERPGGARSAAADTENDLAALLDADVDLDKEMASALAEADTPVKTGGVLGTLRKSPPVGKLGQLGKRDTATAGLNQTAPQESPAAASKSDAGRGTGLPHPRLSMSPKPAGLAPLKRPTTASGLATGSATADKPASPAPQRPGPPPAPSLRPKQTSSPDDARRAPAGKAPAPAPLPKRPAPAPAPLPKKPAPAPLPKKPAPAPLPNKPAPAPLAAKPAPRTSPGPLSDERIRAIHQSYVDARKKTNATEVSYEKLAKSIRETEAKLLASNKGRSIDFDVNIKDGKAILKPRLK